VYLTLTLPLLTAELGAQRTSAVLPLLIHKAVIGAKKLKLISLPFTSVSGNAIRAFAIVALLAVSKYSV
jgi:hypothetical protein